MAPRNPSREPAGQTLEEEENEITAKSHRKQPAIAAIAPTVAAISNLKINGDRST